MKSHRGDSAFTLIEILVVLVIVSVLAGIVYAATGGVREKGRQSLCLSNLRQIGVAFRMYCQDHDMLDSPRRIAESPKLPLVLRTLSKNEAIWKCTSAKNSLKGDIDYRCAIHPYPPPVSFIPLFEDAYSRCGSMTPLFLDINHGLMEERVDIKMQSLWLVLRYEGNVTVARNKLAISQRDLCLQ